MTADQILFIVSNWLKANVVRLSGRVFQAVRLSRQLETLGFLIRNVSQHRVPPTVLDEALL